MELPSHSISTQFSFKQLIWLLCFICLFLLSSFKSGSTPLAMAASSSSRNESDRFALLAIKSQILDDPLGALNSWNQSLHHCDWQGIKCSRRHSERVTMLDLPYKKLGGTLSPYIGNLSFLKAINLTGNNLNGKIPQEIGRLFRLQKLILSSNSFDGEIPSNITYCSDLIQIILHDNKLSGSIFVGLSSLSKLVVLGLDKNNFTGKIPPSLGNLTSLTILSLSRNHFKGYIPDDLCGIWRLAFFQLSINNLTGKIPSCLFNYSSIHAFYVTQNQLEGNIPPNIFLTLPNLRELFLPLNKFSGTIPISLSNATRLEAIGFGYNAFTGSVPRDLGKLKSLRVLNFPVNQIGTQGQGRDDNDDLNFINSLTNCSNLEYLNFAENVLKGPLPHSLSNLSPTIKLISFQDNSIYGSIPVGIGNLVNIERLSFVNNKLTGTIPTSIGKLNQLQELTLGLNLLSGHIPSSLGNLTQLTTLGLEYNNLNESIPPTLGNCTNLATLSLAHNNLVGTIPIQVVSISSMIVLLLFGNSLTGSLPSEVGNLTNLVDFWIHNNKLSGHIPESLGNCLYLNQLLMYGNFFEGDIPKSFLNLRGLKYLDISRNNLSGEIPQYLEQFSDLSYLNLSVNQFQGRVPLNGIFTNASMFSVVGNKNLCGGIEKLKLRPCIQIETKKNTSVSLKVIILIIVGSACSLLLLFFILAFYKRKVLKNNPSPSTLSNTSLYKRVSYLELLQATNGFSSDNLIGVGSYGSVFKGVFDEINQVVAVKVLNLQREGASKSFITECNALRHLRHRNLLKIITACSSVDFQGNDFKALVFEFMPYGSLEEWIHPRVDDQRSDSRNFSFIQRLNVAIDVASALDYLHHHCQPSVVHCDLKPSNVLLDDSMTARLADFGIAKLFSDASYDSEQSHPSSDVIKGSIGYVAPEYGMGVKVSVQGDVYSYGILLLEMFTRKRPTDNMFLNGLSLRTYAEMALPNQVMDIVDPMVLLDDKTKVVNTVEYSNSQVSLQDCLVSIITLGILCSVDTPAERKTMSEVVSELHQIKKHF